MPSKCVLILLDGLGDRSFAELDHLTPLQAAHTPVLDRLASLGANGLYHAAALGQALPSENAHFAMFGYDQAEFPGRGALEALGAGIDLQPGEVALLAHLACLHEEDGCLALGRDRPEVTAAEARDLIASVAEYQAEGVDMRFTATKGGFGILSLAGEVAPFVTDTNTMLEGRLLPEVRPWQEYAEDRAALNTARALRAYLVWAYRRLAQHPINLARRRQELPAVNGMITQRAGRLKDVVPFRQRNGLKGLSISSGIIYWGLCAYLGLDVHKMSDSGDAARDLAERLALAGRALDSYDFIHVHTKEADEAAHRKDPRGKKAVIEALDRGIGRVIEPLLENPEVLVVVTADHSTPSGGALIHSGEPVPLAMVGGGVRRDGVQRFDEVSAAAGALGCVRGKEFIYMILNQLDRAKLAGIRDTPVDQPFYPGDYEPFRLG